VLASADSQPSEQLTVSDVAVEYETYPRGPVDDEADSLLGDDHAADVGACGL
jgi:hypothetical protein